MKSKSIERTLRRHVLLQFFLMLAVISVVYLGLTFLAFNVFQGMLVDLLLSLLGTRLYYALMDTKWIWFAVFYILLVLALFYRTIARTVGYIGPLAESVDQVFSKEEKPVSLPGELAEVEAKLNAIQYASLRSEQAVKEAEQRKNDLVVYLAHDLKTPLTSVIGYLTLLEEAPDMPAEQRAKYTAVSLDKAYRLEQLINEFFEITRFNLQNIELEYGKIDLSLLLGQVADEFYPLLAEKSLAIETDIEEGLVLYGDANKLARVFDNLLRNAVNYSYEGTAIRLSAAREGDAILRVSVRNAGDPISEAQLGRIFEKFFRLDAARRTSSGGAGLGLAIAKQIVERHGGSSRRPASPLIPNSPSCSPPILPRKKKLRNP